ncbi:MAG: hypothetical protein DRO23_07550 [Thermoprotei archaeon]|nr:MAG: hypothetical protein DRO23_07550 [Thermoprotei archaeon]
MPVKVNASLCVQCKGVRRLCGKPLCPILLRFRASVKTISQIRIEGDNVVFGLTPPTLIVGEGGYPEVNIYAGIAPTADPKVYDDPEFWWGRFSLEKIIELRSSLLLPRRRFKVSVARSGDIYEIQLALASRKPVDTEAKLRKKPYPVLRFDGLLAPLGPTAPMERIRIVSNPSVDRVIEKIVSDYDLKAKDAVAILYSHGISVYDIIRVFSAGLLGRLKERKLVPTRWAITAVDSTICEMLFKKIRKYKPVNNYIVYHTTYIGNHFEVLLIPGVYSFEMLEVWLPRTVWTRKFSSPIIIENYELWDGRVRRGIDGGYYALKLGILENLYRLQRQALIIAIREIRPEYYAPVGNWHIRESARKMFSKKPEKFDSLNEALTAISRRLSIDIRDIVNNSVLLRNILRQEKITRYLS